MPAWAASTAATTAGARRPTTCACTATSSACSRSTSPRSTCPNRSPPPTCCARCRATCWPKRPPGAATRSTRASPRADAGGTRASPPSRQATGSARLPNPAAGRCPIHARRAVGCSGRNDGEDRAMEFPVYVQRELEIGGAPAKGATGADVRRVQEWLSLQDCATAVDGQFGPATEAAVRRFQRLAGLRENGRVDRDTWAALNAPMRRVLGVSDAGPGAQLTDTVLALAGLHLAQHPREVGGDNRGPWVRLYMSGAQGPKHYWCA